MEHRRARHCPELLPRGPPEKTGILPHSLSGRGRTYADIDQDRDLGFALTQIAVPPLLLRNDQQTGNQWLRLRLKDRPPNPHALGATVELTTTTGTHRRELQPTRSYLSQLVSDFEFGLGPEREARAIQRSLVTGANGMPRTFLIYEIDRVHVLEQGRRNRSSKPSYSSNF